MGPELLAALLLASVILNVIQYRASRAQIAHWRFAARREADARAHDAQTSEKRLEDLLSRINTNPRLEVRGPVAPPVDLDEQKYWSDEPYHDEAWNDYHGTPDEEEALA